MIANWKRLLLVNVCGAIGVFASIFILPSNTRFWLWAAVSAIVLLILNYLAFSRARSGAANEKVTPAATTVAFLGVFILVIELVLRYVFK